MRQTIAALSLAVASVLAALGTTPADHNVSGQERQPDARTGDIIVRFRSGTSLGAVGGALSDSKTTAVKTTTLPDVARVRPHPGQMVDAAITALEADHDVLYAEPDYVVTMDTVPNDPNYGSQWHYPKIGLPAAWDQTTGSATVIVAVVDTGVELTDTELASKITSGANAGYDFVNGDADPTDDQGHGTHVAGTIAAETNNAVGVAGVCWACKIMPVKVLDGFGSGGMLEVAAGIDWARTHGAKVVNLSLGSLGDSATLRDAVNNAYAAGVVVVGAAGNNAGDADTSDDYVLFPGAYPNAIGVGATDSSDTIASFSNYGPELDVVAPGVGILSTVLGAGYQSWSGTSMATPHVAGVAGLMISAGITDPATIRTKLTSTATDLGTGGFDNRYGYGRINADLAVATADGTPPSVSITSPASGATVSGSVTFSATASDAGGVQKVRFWVDGTYLGYDTTAPYAKTWDTTLFPAGARTLKVEALDHANNSTILTISVNVAGGDVTPPAASITSPASGATVSGSVTFSATASDAGGVQKVRFWVDGTYLGYDMTAPYARTWDSTTVVNGAYTLKVQAVDNAGNVSSYVTVSVSVSN